MNMWTKKSITLANSKGYLDKLSNIYVMQVNPERPIPKDMVKKLKVFLEKKNSKALIRLLIENAEVFPVKDSYIGFLRLKESAIDENPKTVKRIAERLYRLGLKRVIQEASRPKETNRQLGPVFRKWLQSQYKVVKEDYFIRSKKGVIMLKGGDKTLAKFAREKLKCKLKKGIDFVINKNGKFIIGEAKFLTTPGGEQTGGFSDAESFIQEKSGNAIRIAIIDGYIWLKSLSGLHKKIKQNNDNIMSALLLKDFIETL